MAYIYQITNDINGKIYIGKTERSVQERWRKHISDSKRVECQNRPLYLAMNKYGIEHFHIEIIEETNQPEEREKFWIEQKRSYKNGYNATLGGDGRQHLDYDVVIATYQETKSLDKTAEIIGCHKKTIQVILKNNNIDITSSMEINRLKYGNIVNQYTLQGDYIQSFPSLHEAAKSLNKSGVSHISDVCKGKRKTAYGYIWKFAN